MINLKKKKKGSMELEGVAYLFLAIFFILIGYTLFSKVPIKKTVSSDISVVEVEVVSVKHENSYASTTYIPIDDKGSMMPLDTIYPEVYETIIKHQDHNHTISGKATYDFCKDRVDTTIKANVYVNKYEDGTQGHNIDIPLE